MTAEDVIAAMALPGVPERSTRIHKVDLVDAGAATAADKKLIDTVIDRLEWVATLSPATIGVAAGQNASAIQLLTLMVRAEPTARLLTLIHRAIPLPVMLVTVHGPSVRVSLAPLRAAERTEGVVVERLVVTPAFGARDRAIEAFLASLALPQLPQTDLAALYETLVWRVEALLAATRADAPFRLTASADEAQARRAALADYEIISADYARARSAARAEKQLARQVSLAEAAGLVKKRLDAVAMALR